MTILTPKIEKINDILDMPNQHLFLKPDSNHCMMAVGAFIFEKNKDCIP